MRDERTRQTLNEHIYISLVTLSYSIYRRDSEEEEKKKLKHWRMVSRNKSDSSMRDKFQLLRSVTNSHAVIRFHHSLFLTSFFILLWFVSSLFIIINQFSHTIYICIINYRYSINHIQKHTHTHTHTPI